MTQQLLRIAITPPQPRDDEAARATLLLDMGWDYVHMRFPDISLRELRTIIEAIPLRHHRKLRLHGHFDLTYELNLGGLHLNGRCPRPPELYSGRLSITCHTVAEVIAAARKQRFDYATLSPVYASVSKSGYKPSLSPADFTHAVAATAPMPVVALGGITPERVPEVAAAGFGGFAVLGALALAPTMQTLENISRRFLDAH